MPSLAWLAIAGNPLTDGFEAARQAPSIANIDWQDIELGAKLGEGASGVIYEAKLQQTDVSSKQVAIKLFKSAVTSDGMPRSEMAANIAVGLHPHVVGVLGKISHHPNGVMGLVMPLIPPDFINLAQPPSLDSCTRDIYAQETVLSLQELHSLAYGIAQSVAHLHACGVLHGDLYAHNMLYNADGYGLLGDFGAASFLPGSDAEDSDISKALQLIEVRAFGIFLGELLALCSDSVGDAEQGARSKLMALQQCCTQEDVSARPLFADVVHALKFYMDVASSAS